MEKALIFLLLCVFLFATGCGDDEGPSCFTCQFEERRTGCNSTSYGSWEDGSSVIDFELKDGLSPESFCRQTYPSSDIECSSGCCVSFQFRNVRVGSCP